MRVDLVAAPIRYPRTPLLALLAVATVEVRLYSLYLSVPLTTGTPAAAAFSAQIHPVQ